jgi:transcriptional regulator with XRE-family HTH domain
MTTKKGVSVNADIKLREDQLTKFRAMAGLDTEAKLAAAMGAHQGTVNRVLNGKQNPSGEFIASLVKAFKLASFDDLWEIAIPDDQVAA